MQMLVLAATMLLSNFGLLTALQTDPLSLCPRYKDYARRTHHPLSRGEIGLPLQRPPFQCRTFVSERIESAIISMTSRLRDSDVAQLFENCLPNTLDTTIRWHDPAGPQTFVITGDINAMWLRDSTFQLQPYLRFLDDHDLRVLVNGAIQTQAKYLTQFPYCNAFQPPKDSKMRPANNGQQDNVSPPYEPDVVFECKYELDSLSSFLRLSRQYYDKTQDSKLFTDTWVLAVQRVLRVVKEQSQPSFNQLTHLWNQPYYTFRRHTDMATETLALGGAGYPVNANTSLVRSAFRPSDDSTILQFFIPGNAMLSVELQHLSKLLDVASEKGLAGASSWSLFSRELSMAIRDGIFEHGTYDHPEFGRVFVYEVDGYGGRIMMDDANMPSLLSLPLLGFVHRNDTTYRNTRKMLLSSRGNPYYRNGPQLTGIGSPHTPMQNVWPMSLLVQMMTSDDRDEIEKCLAQVVSTTANLGLMHESINAWKVKDYSRPWFAWANAMFAMTIFDLEERFPDLILKV